MWAEDHKKHTCYKAQTRSQNVGADKAEFLDITADGFAFSRGPVR